MAAGAAPAGRHRTAARTSAPLLPAAAPLLATSPPRPPPAAARAAPGRGARCRSRRLSGESDGAAPRASAPSDAIVDAAARGCACAPAAWGVGCVGIGSAGERYKRRRGAVARANNRSRAGAGHTLLTLSLFWGDPMACTYRSIREKAVRNEAPSRTAHDAASILQRPPIPRLKLPPSSFISQSLLFCPVVLGHTMLDVVWWQSID